MIFPRVSSNVKSASAGAAVVVLVIFAVSISSSVSTDAVPWGIEARFFIWPMSAVADGLPRVRAVAMPGSWSCSVSWREVAPDVSLCAVSGGWVELVVVSSCLVEGTVLLPPSSCPWRRYGACVPDR